jgi:hypothetical protein
MALDKVNLLEKRIEMAAKRPDTFTLSIEDGQVILDGQTFDSVIHPRSQARLDAQVKLLEPIAQYLGDLSVVFSVHDTPSVAISYLHREELEECIDINEC